MNLPDPIDVGTVVIPTAVFGAGLGATSCALAAGRGATWVRGALVGALSGGFVAAFTAPDAWSFFSQNPLGHHWATLIGVAAGLVVAVLAGAVTGLLSRRVRTPPSQPLPPSFPAEFKLEAELSDSWSGKYDVTGPPKD